MDHTEKNIPSPRYWMSLEQWRQDPEFLKFAESEFQSSPLQSEDGKGGWARREFLKLMGASMALTTFGCIRRPAQKIIPYAKKPPEVVHGIPNYYASAYADGLEGLGILVTTRDGRPLKIEGNTDHLATAGGMSARAHAHILKLYDPDRYTGPKHNPQNETRSNHEFAAVKWEDLDTAVIAQLKKGKVALLVNSHLSPTTQMLIDDFAGSYGAKTYRYDDIGYESVAASQKASYGQSGLPRYHIEKAKYIVAVNNDFLGTWMAPVMFTRQFVEGRKADENMNKLVVFESLLSLTGSNADLRFRIRPSQSLDVVMALLHEIVVNKKFSHFAGDQQLVKVLSAYAETAKELDIDVASVAQGLIENKGRSVVLAGGMATEDENAVTLQVATNFLNQVLGNEGKTVEPMGAVLASGKIGLGMGDLLKALKNKEISTLIIHGPNPAYSLPASGDFKKLASNAQMIIYTGDRGDETARMADYIATDNHALENWGDVQSLDGSLSIQQPTIRPLYDTRAFQDSLLVWAKESSRAPGRVKTANAWYDYLHDAWKAHAKGKSMNEFWVDILQKGVLPSERKAPAARAIASSALHGIKPSESKTGFELALYSTIGLGDSQLANVPWLQEFPDPVTKIVWDNYACFSIRDAKQLKIREGQIVELKIGDKSLKVASHVQPGQADGVVGLAVGYGRQGAGSVADGVGVNAFELAQWNGERRLTGGLQVAVTTTSDFNNLACVQGHHTMEGRQIVVEETLAQHIKNPGGAIHRHKVTTMWSEHKYNGNKWGMVIDLNSCTGCGSCIIACQSENNIPTVGKTYVLEGREMHWLRVDRYYTGNPEDPGVVNQPVVCMHCDNAPCETVCPVIATMHSEEGTNDMIYNRCVGTRYCSNNCPYKVRRFNWFDYTEIQAPRQLASNPEVSIRNRGVMEKCTFCIHRIRFSKSQAKDHGRKLATDEIKTACQQSCPVGCITFGDLNDPNSAVAKEFNQPQSYALLEELNTRPAVHYQVKVRNSETIKGATHSEEGHHV
jgi:molybdopterin-containing oxidoreductase family iron-sulfur binding subunit